MQCEDCGNVFEAEALDIVVCPACAEKVVNQVVSQHRAVTRERLEECRNCKSEEVLESGLCADCERARNLAIRQLAFEQCNKDGEVEVEMGETFVVSEGDDNGCYVSAWVWVDFAGTEFDKEKIKSEDCSSCHGAGWLAVNVGSGTQPKMRIECCDECNKYASDYEAVNAAFKESLPELDVHGNPEKT